MELVSLQTSDGDVFKLELSLAQKFQTIDNLIQDAGVNDLIPLKSIDSKIFSKIVDYLMYHHKHEDTEKRDTNFFQIDDETLFSIILAVNYLNYPELLDACCKKIASEIRGKTVEEIKKRYNIN
jgi:S-phase kinase-associated protein 1